MRRTKILTLELKRVDQNVVKDCEICNRYKKTRPHPVVSLSLVTRFNEVIAVDSVRVFWVFLGLYNTYKPKSSVSSAFINSVGGSKSRKPVGAHPRLVCVEVRSTMATLIKVIRNPFTAICKRSKNV